MDRPTAQAPRTHDEVLAAHVPLAGARVVDVGCGSGALSRALRSHGAEVTGLECGAEPLQAARLADPDHADRYVEGVGQDLPFGDGELDAVVYSYALHHVPAEHLDAALAEAARVLRPGGLLYVVEPVAAGPAFEVVRLIDDETEVRALAQQALQRAADAGLELVTRTAYRSEMVHAGPASMQARVVGADAGRAAAFERHRVEFAERFLARGRPVEGGYAFSQDNLVEVWRKPA